MPTRQEIINIIGSEYLKENIENGEFSYKKAGANKGEKHYRLDLRFFAQDTAILVETKQKFKNSDKKQLFDYVEQEKRLKTKNIIAILADTTSDRIKVWKNDEELKIESQIRYINEYIQMFNIKNINDKQKVMQSTFDLNKKLHGHISERLRSQFVGTCLLALKNKLIYENLATSQILAGISDILNNLLKNNTTLQKSDKISLLNRNVLDEQEIKELKTDYLQSILQCIKDNILPFIDDNSNLGQDLLNLFFTTFNKYVGKADKNQAFTPDHIVHFMCKVARINKKSYVLDPTCGSGSFLVQAMTQALSDCSTEVEKQKVKNNQIFGIEKEHKAFVLASINMLIHGDGNSNIRTLSCFDRFKENWLPFNDINIVLMNPPYNATIKDVPEKFYKTWNLDKDDSKSAKMDPTKGFFFVFETAKLIKQGVLLCLLPLSCAIGSDSKMREYKYKMLQNNTLEAVFTLPTDMFHPGSGIQACCMVFKLGQPHPKDFKTFFGYYRDDGFIKKKNLGRVDVKNRWDSIEKEWLKLYNNLIEKPGMSVRYIISPDSNDYMDYDKEWLAEAYMKTDYSNLTEKDFEKTVRDFLSYKIQFGDTDE